MTPKTIIIHHCDDCPYFDNAYPHHMEQCEKLDRGVPCEKTVHPIPEWCPLEEVTDTMTDYLVSEK